VADRQLVIEAKEPLAPYMVDAGWHLLEAIDKQVHFSTALWFYWEPSNSWRLIIILPGVKEGGTKKFYVQILAILQENRQLRPDERAAVDRAANSLMVVDEEDTLARDIRHSIVAELGMHQFGRSTSSRKSRQGRYFPDGYVYKFAPTRRELRDAPLHPSPDERTRDERHISDD